MKIQNFLALDTSGNHLSVLASKNGRTERVFIENCAMRHAVNIMPAVEEALRKAELNLAECDFFSAVVGAGSFTGIRIGISAVKGFCLAFGKPALPVTSFDLAAYNGLDADPSKKYLCLVDALHDCYYACGYEGGKVILPPAYLSETEVLALADAGYTLCACGELPLARKIAVEVFHPCDGLERAVHARAESGLFGELTALYVRKSSAELNLGK